MWTKGDNAAFTLGLVLIVGVICFLFMMPAKADTTHSHHGHGHDQLHQWYSTLMRPDFPGSSCCNDKDCRPTQSRWNGSQWEAMKDGRWITVPNEKVIVNRTSIDTRAHMCAPPSSHRSYGADYVFCLVPGGGI
jgi:hypothetical protein